MVWIAVAYNLYYAVAYPIYNTANSTMIPVSTRDSKQRGALASFTNIAGLGVMGCGSMVFPMLVSFALKEDQHLWFVAMLAVAIFSAITIYLQFLFTRERVTEEGRGEDAAPKKAASLGEQLKAVTGDRMWWIVMAFYMLFQWSGAMKNGSMSYYCKWVLDNTFFGNADAWGASQSLLSIMGAIPMAVAAVFVVPLANKFGKRTVCGVFMALGAVGGVIAGLGGGHIIPVAIGVALKCLLVPGLLPDPRNDCRCYRPYRIPHRHPHGRPDDEHLQLADGRSHPHLQLDFQRHAQRQRLQSGR